MQSPRRWHTKNWYHPSPQQRYLEAQKPKKRAKVLLFFGLTKCFVDFFVKKDFEVVCKGALLCLETCFRKEWDVGGTLVKSVQSLINH